MSKGFWPGCAFIMMLLFHSCTDTGRQRGNEKVFAGRLSVVADVGLEKIMRQQAEVFRNLYDSVEVAESYADEATMMEQFRRGEVNVMLLTRKLTEAERKRMIEQDTLYVRELEVAYDAIVMIGGKGMDDSNMDTALLKSYVSHPTASSPLLVFDSRNSSISSYILRRAEGMKDGGSPKRMFAVASAEEVIDYVAQQPNSIGFIPYQYISDETDRRRAELLKRVKILSLRAQSEEGKAIRASANQSDIAMGYYPLTRPVNVVIRYGHQDNPEWWFMSFLYREKGAKVFLKAGFVPARIPQREINVNTGEIPVIK